MSNVIKTIIEETSKFFEQIDDLVSENDFTKRHPLDVPSYSHMRKLIDQLESPVVVYIDNTNTRMNSANFDLSKPVLIIPPFYKIDLSHTRSRMGDGDWQQSSSKSLISREGFQVINDCRYANEDVYSEYFSYSQVSEEEIIEFLNHPFVQQRLKERED